MERVVVEDLDVELRRSGRRRTVEIVVGRRGEVALLCPETLTPEGARRAIRGRLDWIYEKQAVKALLLASGAGRLAFETNPRELYLGRSYALELVDEQPEPLKLVHGRFRFRRADHERARAAFATWYGERGSAWIGQRIRRFLDPDGLQPSDVLVRDLGSRWGACSAGGRLSFHWKLMRLHPRLVDYVIAHEVVHLRVPDHGPAFWRQLAVLMPDYATRKAELAGQGAAHGDLEWPAATAPS